MLTRSKAVGSVASVIGVRAAELIPGFRPETELERTITEDPELLAGLEWGLPRTGHPEGAVGAHVADLLRRVDEAGETGERREWLRLLVLLHDSFKYRVAEGFPRVGENHHAMRARRFAERYTDDEGILSALELHDRPYGIWRYHRRTGRFDPGVFDAMMEAVADPDLFLAFVRLDGSTEGKSEEPGRWFESELERRGYLTR